MINRGSNLKPRSYTERGFFFVIFYKSLLKYSTLIKNLNLKLEFLNDLPMLQPYFQ